MAVLLKSEPNLELLIVHPYLLASLQQKKKKKALTYFFAPPRGEFNKWHNTKKHTRTLAAVAPAEAGSIYSTVSVVWKEETFVFVRGRARIERTALGIVGAQNKVVEAVQD
jgi:uncharacterized protein VirK/YbjX